MRGVGRVVCAMAVSASLGAGFATASDVTAAVQAKIDAQVKVIQQWASSPDVVEAVKSQNGSKAPEAAAMTQEKWASLPVLDPFVRALTKNAAATYLKSQKSAAVSEAFVSSADGSKVATLAKPTNWSHKGKPKHDVPMTGKVWQGPVEVDASSGAQQVQVAVPVMDGGKPIGSLVVGLSITELSK